MKILILSDQCNPEFASLPSFSHSLAKAIAANVDITLVTHVRNREGIENDPYKFDEVIYIDNEYIASPLHHVSNFLRRIGIGGWMTNMAFKYPSNIVFEFEAYKKLKDRLKRSEFDFVHRLSPVSPTIPSPIASWTDTPFILGPLNGSLAWPRQYREEIKKERELLVHIRNAYKLLPYYKSTFRKAAKVLSAFKHVEKDVPIADRSKIERFNELGVDTDLYRPSDGKVFSSDIPCKFLFVGRLVPYKCPHVVITAFANSEVLRQNHHLSIIGDGPERESLQKLIDENALGNCVSILGWKEQVEVARYMSQSDIFVFPTIREVGGNVILEAMSAGLPSIVPDYGGPSELIDDETGIKIPLSDKDVFLQAFIDSMEMLASDTEKRKLLSQNARKAAMKSHSWPQKGIQMKSIYDSIEK